MPEKAKVPAIRFNGFTDAWEQRKVSDIADIVGGGTPSTINPEYWDGDIDWYAPAEMEGQRYAVGSVKKITELGLQKSSAQMLPAGRTVLFTSRAGIGKMAILQCSAATNQGFQSIVLKDGTNPYFIYSMGSELKKKAEGIASGSTFLEISGKMLSNLVIAMPSKQEQNKIACYFEKIDDLITLHQRKLLKLKNIKKAMLEKMFPKNGRNVPEIRFAGFTDAWEQRQFGELARIRRGLTYNPTNVRKDGVRVLRSSNINEDTFVFKDDDVFVEPKAANIDFVKDKDILITSANGSSRLVGKHALVKNTNTKAVHGGFMLLATAEEPEFTNFLMSSPWYDRFIGVYVAGGNGAIGNLSKTDLEEQNVFVPVVSEQRLIGEFFANLDNLITLHQRKYEKLQNLKKACLEKMFV